MKSFKNLSDKLEERIAELTPKTVNGKKISIHVIDKSVLLHPEKEEHSVIYRLTYANIYCKVRNKVRSQNILLRSGPKIAEELMKKSKKLSFDAAKAAGWQDNDIFYDLIINGIFKKDVFEERYNGKEYPEISYYCNSAQIVIADYFGQQFVGWYFYNDNLDQPLNYSSYVI